MWKRITVDKGIDALCTIGNFDIAYEGEVETC